MKQAPGVTPSLSRKFGRRVVNVNKQYQRVQKETEAGEGSEDPFVKDQVIIIPDIMELVLELLDFRSLKKLRLVCKSWLLAAQSHMTKKGTVRLYREFSQGRVQEFMELLETKIPGLPQPFQSIEVDNHNRYEDEPDKRILTQLPQRFPSLTLTVPKKLPELCPELTRKRFIPWDGQVIVYLGNSAVELREEKEKIPPKLPQLCPGLALTRFIPYNLQLEDVLALVVQCSSTLEYLVLFADSSESEHSFKRFNFPKLRHIDVHATHFSKYKNRNRNCFPSIVAGIANASPNLDTYKYWRNNTQDVTDLASNMLLKVGITHVKTLVLNSVTLPDDLSDAAMEHVCSIPFSQLQSLYLRIYTGSSRSNAALIATLRRSATTLKILDLRCIALGDISSRREFPVCPNVHELTLPTVPYLNGFIHEHFPSLQVLNAHSVDKVEEAQWDRICPLSGLKTLRIHLFKFMGAQSLPDDEPFEFKFFKNFPALERLGVQSEVVLRCCELRSSGDPRFSTLLESIKHVELLANGNTHSSTRGAGYSSLALLKGVETIAVSQFHDEILTLPIGELPCLKVIQFPWGNCWRLFDDEDARTSRCHGNSYPYMEQFLEMAGRVKRIAITNCCSFPRLGNKTRSYDLLNAFFDSAPNVECGCREWKTVPEWILDPDSYY